MQLMTEKGLLARSERFGSHVYEASVPKEQTQQQIAGDLLKRAFSGSAGSLVMGALSAQPASREELAEIRGMLDTFVKQKGRSSMNTIQILSSQPWVERLGWTLVHFLWQGLAIAALYAAHARRWRACRARTPDTCWPARHWQL